MRSSLSTLKLVLMLLLLTTEVVGQIAEPSEGAAKRHKVGNEKKVSGSFRPIEIQNLVGEAYSAPAEFVADAFIRLAGSHKVTDKQWKKELLDAAFRFATDAQQPVRRKSAVVGNYSVDTDVGYLSYAFDLKLDTLSLRSRAVQEMLKLDKARARAMFIEMSPSLKLAPLSCEDGLVYEVSDFYLTLRAVALETFTPVEIEQGAQGQFLLPYVEAISAHGQVVPILKVLSSLKLTQGESLTLIHALTQTLKKIAGDDRSFSYELVRGGMSREINQMVQALDRQEISTKEFLSTYHDYLQRNLKSARCADSGIVEERTLSYYVKEANILFFNDNPLTKDNIKSEEVSGTAKVYEYWKSADAARLVTLVRELRFGSKTDSSELEESVAEEKSLTDAEKRTPAWQARLGRVLNELDEWDRKKERTEIDFFHQKQVLYTALLEITPSGLARDLILRKWITSLDERSIEKLSRVEWFMHTDHLLRTLRDLPKEERPKMLEAVISSKNPAIALYARLTQLQM